MSLFQSNISQRKNINPVRTPSSQDKTQQFQKQLDIESQKLEKLSSKAHLMQQQIDLYQCEKNVAFERYKDILSQFNKSSILAIYKIKTQQPELDSLAHCMIKMLDIQVLNDANFEYLKTIIKKPEDFIKLLQNYNTEILKPQSLEISMKIWKDYKSYQGKLLKESKPALLILDWIFYATETKIKSDTLLSIERKFPDFQKSVKEQLENISRLKAQIQIEMNKSKNSLLSNEDTFSARKSARNLPTLSDTKKISGETEKEEIFTEGNTLNKAIVNIKGGLRLDDSKIQENSLLLDVPLTPHEHGFSFKDSFKPKPKKIIEEDKKIKTSKIVLNNLLENQENLIGQNLYTNRVFTTAQFYNDLMNGETYENMSEPNEDTKQSRYKKVQEIPDSSNVTQIDYTQDTIACCGRSIKTKFFCK